MLLSEQDAYTLSHHIDARAERAHINLYAWVRRAIWETEGMSMQVDVSYEGEVRTGIHISSKEGRSQIVIAPWAPPAILDILCDALDDWMRRIRRTPLLSDSQRRQVVLDYIRLHPGCTIRDVSDALVDRGLAKMTCQRCINRLIGDGTVDVKVLRNVCGGGSRHHLTVHEGER
jgi:hypothetical protein